MKQKVDENLPWLKLRNSTTRDEETYCKYYTKRFRGYIRHIFINTEMVGVVLGMIFVAVLLVITKAWDNEDKWSFYIGISLFSICFLYWVYSAIKGLWFWKYAKYVVVTNEGIWIMIYGWAFWRAKDYSGKRRFLSPCWSLYDWRSIKITDDAKARPSSHLKSVKFFEKFDYEVIKSSHLSSLFLTRFDGVEEIHFLDKADTDEILEYAEEYRKNKRKKKNKKLVEKVGNIEVADEQVENNEE